MKLKNQRKKDLNNTSNNRYYKEDEDKYKNEHLSIINLKNEEENIKKKY